MACLSTGGCRCAVTDDKDGNKRTATEVVANTMQMLDRANRGADGGTYERAPRPGTTNGGSTTFDDNAPLEEEESPF